MEIKELKLEELSTEQKIGMVMCGHIYHRWDRVEFDENLEYAIDLIKDHKLGAIWVDPGYHKFDEAMSRIKEAADYPILIVTDAESGFGAKEGMNIGFHNAIGTCNRDESAYAFGKITAIKARNMGYNVVCNPVVDMTDENCTCGGTMRGIGSDKYRVSELAAAEAQGMHDGGVLTVGKHYPSAKGDPMIDSHMAENVSDVSREKLVNYCLYPYLELNKKGLLDGIMTGHCRLTNIDDQLPASLSKKTIDVIRDLGFEGFAITDALVMMGVVAKYGNDNSKGMSIAAGNDLALTWGPNKDGYEALINSYKNGIIPDEMLDAGVKRVLEAQHKVTLLKTDAVITEEDLKNYHKLNTDGVYAKTDDGVETALPKDKKHFFVIFSQNENDVSGGEINVDTMQKSWYNPIHIKERLEKLYPDSGFRIVREYPSQGDSYNITDGTMGYDDLVFVTFTDVKAYVGAENFAPRVISLFKALQVTNRISTILHYGNPFVLEDLPHISRVLIGGASDKAVDAGIDVLAGDYPAKGSLTYNVKFQ
jgi:beta-glucosidase-like glycosyl hydrolase